MDPPVDPALPGLAVFFDSNQLSELLGRPVRADRLRHKPGTSAVARLREADGGVRWVATYNPDAEVKLEKPLSRAAITGLRIDQVALPDHPGQERHPGQSGEPGQQAHPDHPGQLAQSGHPGQPGQPGQPAHSGQSGHSGYPGQPGQPGQSGHSGYPGQPGQLAHPGPLGHSLVAGPIELDHRLYPALRPFRKAGLGRIFSDRTVEVLNYNPQRRVVFALSHLGERLVCKLGASVPRADGKLLAKLASNGVPVLETVERAGLPTSSHVQYFKWFGSGDLSTIGIGESSVGPGKSTVGIEDGAVGTEEQQDPGAGEMPAAAPSLGAASYAAGVALAQLHAQPPAFETHRWSPAAGSLRDLMGEISLLRPDLSDRLERLCAGLEPLLRRPGRAALIHGDFSSDQVLVDGSDIRLTDLERCTYGAGASDLGSFAAVESLHNMPVASGTKVLSLPRTAAMLDGYSAGPTDASEAEVLAWTVFHLLNRLSAPFRACSPTWRQDMVNQLDLMEDILW